MNFTLLFSCYAGGKKKVLLIENAWFSTTRREALPDPGFFWTFWVLCRTVKTLQLWLWDPAVQDRTGAGVFPWWKKLTVPCGHCCGFACAHQCHSDWVQHQGMELHNQLMVPDNYPWHGKPCPASQSAVLGLLEMMVVAHPLGDQPASCSTWNPWQVSERPIKAAS